MSYAPDILDPQDLQKRIADAATRRNNSRQNLLPPDKLRDLLRKQTDSSRVVGSCTNIYFVHSSLELALLENANGAAASGFRDLLREGIVAYEPIAELDDSAEGRGDALCAALMCWEFDAAERIATACESGRPKKHDRGNCFGLWRAAILGRTREAMEFLDALPEPRHGNPPQRRELAEGVLRGDAKLVRAGLKATSVRFKKAWTLKTWCTPAQLKYYGTAARIVPDVCRRLISHHWLLSNWAVGWMSLAWHRGLTGAFGEPKLFSSWVPWELCCPEPNPGAGVAPIARAAQARPKKPGKLQLRAELFAAAASGNV